MMMQHGGGSNIDGTYWRNASPVVKKGARPWNYISQTKAIKVSESLVNTASANSTLINSYMWDTTLNYFISSGAKTQDVVISNSKSWGNYADAEFTPDSGLYSTDWCQYSDPKVPIIPKPAGTWRLFTTGATTNRNVAKNIHDLAGNFWEWTTENYNGSGSVSYRGGCGHDGGDSYPAAYRSSYNVVGITNCIGFRLGLYLL